HFFIAINVEAFTELNLFKKTTGEILRALRASKKAPGQNRIYTAGEKEYETMQKRLVEGIPLDEEEQKDMIAIRDTFHLDYTFPFENII
ncbi:MAG: Ldh family oxidoreductase, partial [Brevinematales bacterium]